MIDGQVQHLIEKCIIFKLSKEECMEALSKHANIKPVITSTGIIYIHTHTFIISSASYRYI